MVLFLCTQKLPEYSKGVGCNTLSNYKAWLISRYQIVEQIICWPTCLFRVSRKANSSRWSISFSMSWTSICSNETRMFIWLEIAPLTSVRDLVSWFDLTKKFNFSVLSTQIIVPNTRCDFSSSRLVKRFNSVPPA